MCKKALIDLFQPTARAIAIYINGKKQSYDQPPVIDNGRTLVPLRGIFESLGATVQWDQRKQQVTAKLIQKLKFY